MNNNILVVTNPENNDTIHCYAAWCTNDRKNDVKSAFECLEFEIDDELIEEIAQELLHHRNYWYNEIYCFEVITV